VAHQEAVALKRQEELIREEEAAGLAEIELKAKRSAAEKEKRAKKKQVNIYFLVQACHPHPINNTTFPLSFLARFIYFVCEISDFAVRSPHCCL
jgi:hypothetical protein